MRLPAEIDSLFEEALYSLERIGAPADPALSPSDYLEGVCRRRRLSVLRDVWRYDRSRTYVRRLREIASEMRLAGYSYPEIGTAMHRDHSTIMHALAARPGERP